MKSIPAGRIIFGLNALLNFHSKRIGHYVNLVDNSRDIELVLLFNKYATQSKEYILRLHTSLTGYDMSGFLPPKSTLGFLLKQFLQNLAIKERNEMLSTCEALEREGLKIYNVATALSFLPTELREEIQKQMESIEEAIRTFIMLRENKTEIQIAQ